MSEPTLGERLTRIETQLESLLDELKGNGSPGRIGKLETAVDVLERDVSRAKGVYVGISTAVSAAFAAITLWFSQR